MAPSAIDPPSTSSPIAWDAFTNIIDGKPQTSSKTYRGTNPSTLETLWPVPVASKEDVDAAVSSARSAFSSWSTTPFSTRTSLLLKFGQLAFKDHAAELTSLLMTETGKPPFVAGIEIQDSYNHCAFHAGLTLPEETYEDDDKVITTKYVPMGIAAGIIPWNFPVVLAVGKICAALLTGNCMIIKPSPFTPYTALKVVEIAQQVFPPGVLQVLGGDERLGPWLVQHPGIQKISFTGSIATGKAIMAECAKTLKRVTLELGGNDACIVCDDVDVQKVAPQVALGCFFNTGQMCVCTKRVYVQEGIYEEFSKALVAFTEGLKVGGPGMEGVMVGPLQNGMQFEKVKGFYKDARKDGNEFMAGGGEDEELVNGEKGKGYFLKPAIVAKPPHSSRLVQEEQFGPIVPLLSFTTPASAIALANSTPFALGASIWTTSPSLAQEFTDKLEAGMVFVNSFEKPCCQGYMSGWKESGVGGESGKLGVKEYCNVKVVHVYK